MPAQRTDPTVVDRPPGTKGPQEGLEVRAHAPKLAPSFLPSFKKADPPALQAANRDKLYWTQTQADRQAAIDRARQEREERNAESERAATRVQLRIETDRLTLMQENLAKAEREVQAADEAEIARRLEQATVDAVAEAEAAARFERHRTSGDDVARRNWWQEVLAPISASAASASPEPVAAASSSNSDDEICRAWPSWVEQADINRGQGACTAEEAGRSAVGWFGVVRPPPQQAQPRCPSS